MELLNYDGLSEYKSKYDEQLSGIVADVYDNTSTYSIGDYCIHYAHEDNKLYKCIVDIVEAEEWNATHWIEVTTTGELEDIQDVLDDIEGRSEDKVYGPADIVTFDSNAEGVPFKKIESTFTPTQDLHGMPYPYPAGASVNLIPDTTDTSNGYVSGYYLTVDGTTTAYANYYISEYITLDAETTYTWSNRVNTDINPSICFYDENKEFISGVNINKQYSYTFMPPEGTVYCRSSQTTYDYQASASNAAYQLEVGSTATKYRRYSNICPISGWAGANILAAGVNILGTKNENGYFATYIPANTAITISEKTSSRDTVRFYRKDKTRIVYYYLQSVSGDYRYRDNLKIVEPVYYVKFDNNNTEQQCCFGTDLRPYKLPSMTNLPINWQTEAGTIYGGTVTLNEDGSADLVSDMRFRTLVGTESWATEAETGTYNMKFKLNLSDMMYGSSMTNVLTNYIKRRKSQNEGYKDGSLCCQFGWNDHRIFVLNATKDIDDVTDLASWKAYLAEHPLEIIYPLTTPITYHFDNIGQLKSFIGQNNVWTSLNGTTKVTLSGSYLKTITNYVKSIPNLTKSSIAPTETSYTATSNYSINDIFFVNDTLYRATAQIASGGTITPDTNCVKTSIDSELTSLLN